MFGDTDLQVPTAPLPGPSWGERVNSELPPIALADDGDLEDVRRLLEKLDLRFLDAWHGDVPSDALWISNSRHALEASAERAAQAERRSFHIVILEEDSPSLRSALKEGRFDFIVQRPVHPIALRLLILHALYSGPERRTNERVAMSAEVKLGSGLRPRPATLTQLSEKGCGLLCAEALSPGDRTQVAFPRSLTRGRPLSLEGRVVGSQPSEGDGPGQHEISVAFRPPPAAVRERLRTLMARHGIGSATIRPRKVKAALRSPAASEAPPAAAGSQPDRRRSPRKSYCRPVLAAAKGAVHTIVGRDLSTGGMRVAPDERLEKGDEFKLVIYGRAGRTPLLVKAVVARNDGPAGCVLQFREVGPSIAAALEEMVASLPRFAGGERAPNVVVSEVIEDA